jgi:hypothetical protein
MPEPYLRCLAMHFLKFAIPVDARTRKYAIGGGYEAN